MTPPPVCWGLFQFKEVYKINNNDNFVSFSFLIYPKALNDSEYFNHLSVGARLLFALILDRMKLSEINSEKFTDANGNLFVYYTVEEAAEKLGCCKDKAIKVIKELENSGFIIRKKSGFSLPARISIPKNIVKKFDISMHNSDLQSAALQTSVNPDYNSRKNRITTVDKTDSINTEYNNIHKSNTESSSFDELNERILEQIEYDCLQGDMRMIKEVALIMTQVVHSPPPAIKINGSSFSGAFVAERFLSLTAEEIQHVIYTLEESGTKIRNAKQYIISLLFNSPAAVAIENSAEYFAAG